MQNTRLDFLANFPQNQHSNTLCENAYPHFNALNPAIIQTLQEDSTRLSQRLGKAHCEMFGFRAGDFLSLFCTLYAHQYKIALCSSLHQQSFYAGKLFEKIAPEALFWIHLDQKGTLRLEGKNSVQSAIKAGANVFFIPLINQDILTINPIESLLKTLQTHIPNFIAFIDISMQLSLLNAQALSSLTHINHPRILWLANAENVGLAPSYGGMFFSQSFYDDKCHTRLLEDISALSLWQEHFFKSFDHALTQILAQEPIVDSKHLFYQTLKKYLGENLDTFASLDNTPPNALPLRFRNIKARTLIQALSVEQIFAINGQDCLFGKAKPSFVLQTMGYEEKHCRELLSISYRDLQPHQIDTIAQKIAFAYQQIIQLHI